MKKLVFFVLLILSRCFTACEKPETSPKPEPPATPVTLNAIYVSPTGSDANDGKTINTAVRTPDKGMQLVTPGDTLFLLNGTYTNSAKAVLTVNKSGSEGKYITIKAYPGHKPKFFANGQAWMAVEILASYISLEGIEMMGDNAGITLEEALANKTSGNPKYNCTGLNIGRTYNKELWIHHINVRNCVIHDFPGAGIQTFQADYMNIENNIVYNTCWYTQYGPSGISVWHCYNSDQNTDTKVIVRGNIVYGNKTQVPYSVTGNMTDGNGIIIDENDTPLASSSPLPGYYPYKGRILAENNIVYNNGGSGIHSYKSSHVDLINNTAYKNCQVMNNYGEIFANVGSDNRVFNNIMYARDGGNCTIGSSAHGTYSNNLYFNGTAVVVGANAKMGDDPKFKNPVINGSGDFSLQEGSPAIDAGSSTVRSSVDIAGVPRPQRAGYDIGAYEMK